MRRNAEVAVVLLVVLLVGCSGGSETKLVVTGSSTIAPVMSDIASDFERANPGVEVNVQSGGSSRGIADVERGTADIGMASRDLREAESHLQAHTFARDGITMIVHSDNPLRQLDKETVRRIYRGDIDHWSALSDYQEPVSVVHKSEGRATLAVFLAFMDLDNDHVRPHMVVGENQQAIQSVAGNPGAIGYVSIGAAEHEASRGVSIKPVALNGVSPEPETVASGAFPMTRNLNLVTDGETSPVAQRFIEYVTSKASDARIREHFFIPVNDASAS